VSDLVKEHAERLRLDPKQFAGHSASFTTFANGGREARAEKKVLGFNRSDHPCPKEKPARGRGLKSTDETLEGSCLTFTPTRNASFGYAP
jgi:hypothetical protein